MLDAIALPTPAARRRRHMSSVPTPHSVPPTPPVPGHPDVVDPDDPVNPEPATPVQEPPDEGDVPTRLPGHPGKPAHVHARHTQRHEHPGA
ncbi:hypothetical protein ASF43_04350 [Pseudorhodoferax sp. Leaf267]|nr:hypothetical protein ASF43_04350 [Pseudorhodoferax sp. Leaf267]